MSNKLKITVQAETAKARESLEKVSNSVNQVSNSQKSLNSVASSFISANPYVIGGAAAVVAIKKLADGVAECINTTNEYNKSIANVATLIPNSTERINELREAVTDLSIDTGKPLDDLSDGLYQVVSAFGDNSDTIKRLEIVAKAAKAGVADTTDSLNLLSAVTKAYGDTSSSAMKKVSDLSFLTVKLGQTTFPELASSIQNVTDASQRVGVSQEELFTVFSTLTGVTGGAAEVSTQLKSALLGLETPTKDLSKLYDKLGVSSGTALIQQYGLAGAFKEITDYSNETGISLQSLIGRAEAISAVSALSTTQFENYSDKLNQISDSAGATDEALNEITNGINSNGFEVEKNTAKWEKLKIQIGDGLLPITEGLNETLGILLTKLNGNSVNLNKMESSINDLFSATSDYKQLTLKLNEALTSQEKALIAVQKQQKISEMNSALSKLSSSYSNTQKEQTKFEDSLKDANSTYGKNLSFFHAVGGLMGVVIDKNGDWIETMKESNRVSDDNLSTNMRLSEALTKLGYTDTAFIMKLSEYNDALETIHNTTIDLNDITTEQNYLLSTVASGVLDGAINIDYLTTSNKELYSVIQDKINVLKEEKKAQEDANKAAQEANVIAELNTPDINHNSVNPKTKNPKTDDSEKTTIDNLEYQNSLLLSNSNIEKLELERKNELSKYDEKETEVRTAINNLYNTKIKIAEKELTISKKKDELNSKFELAQLNYNSLVESGASAEEISLAKITQLQEEKNLKIQEAIDTYGDESKYVEEISKYYDLIISKEEKANSISSKITQFIKDNSEYLSDETKKKEQIDSINKKILSAQSKINDAKGEEKDKIQEIIDKLKLEKSTLENTSLSKTWADSIDEFINGGSSNDFSKSFKENWEETIGSLTNKYGEYVNNIISGINKIEQAQIKADQSILNNEENKWEKEKSETEKSISDQQESSEKIVEALKKQYDSGAISYGEYLERKTAAESEWTAAQEELDAKTAEKEEEFKARQNELDKKQFEANKKNQISEILINTATAIIKGYSQLGLIGGTIAAASLGTISGIQIGQVAKQQFVPALAEGGVATKPTMALIGEGGEPEMVLPLSKAKEQGFGSSSNNTIIINLNGKTYLTKDEVYESIYDGISKAQKIGKIKQW